MDRNEDGTDVETNTAAEDFGPTSKRFLLGYIVITITFTVLTLHYHDPLYISSIIWFYL